MRREHVDDTVDGRCRTYRMKCREHKVSCLSRGYCGTDRFKITHLTNENDVRILTKCRTKRYRIIVGIYSYLTLIDYGLVMSVQILYRVLKRDNMCIKLAVDLADDRCERG